MNNKNLLLRIQEYMSTFSKSHKKIAAFILEQPDKAAYMTAAKLGSTVGISESTVVRFATELGFDGYPSMQRNLQEVIKSKLTSVERMSVSSERLDSNNVLKSVLQFDMEKIKQTIDEIDENEFNTIVDKIANAEKIYLLGVRSSSSLAGFLGFYFNLMFDNVRLVQTTSVIEMFEQILNINEKDVMIGISFPRYSTRTTNAMNYAKSRGADTIAITDNKESPIAQISDNTLIARSDMVSFVDSLVAPLSVLNALIVAICLKKGNAIAENFERLEKIWDEYSVYEKYDSHEGK